MKKIIILLCIALMLTVFAGAAESDTKELKILAIGNSFSVDAMQYLWDIANDGGYTLTLGNLYIGGCSLDTHAKNISQNNASYTYYKNTSGAWSNTASTSVATAIADEEWDIITVQQASNYSGITSSYSKLPDILNYLATAAPSAKVYFHMTWAYQADSTHSGFANYDGNQMTMYNAIQSAMNTEVKTKDQILGIIPSGTAVQNLRTSYIGDTLTRDGYHMSYSYGRYTTALTWYAYFTGEDIAKIDWYPEEHAALLSKNKAAIHEAVNAAINTPYSVTTVTAKDPGKIYDEDIFASLDKNINSYKKVDWMLAIHAYYNSASTTIPFDLVSSANSSASNLKNFIASYKFTKETLPEGSVLIVDEGYRYRPEGWVDENYVATNATRPVNVTDTAVVVTEEWWGDFTIRAFNISTTETKTMEAADVAHFRIYVPLYPNMTIVNSADTDANGSVSVTDVLMTLKAMLNESGTASDMDGDGIITALDVLKILKIVIEG